MVAPQGVAADLTATLVLGAGLQSRLGDKLSLGASGLTVRVALNTARTAVDETVVLAGVTQHIVVKGGPFLLVQAGALADSTAGTPERLVDLTVMGQRLTGVFSFEQVTTTAGTKVVRIGFTKVGLFLGDSGVDPASTDDDAGLQLSNGTGALLLLPGGAAGSFTATVALTSALQARLGGGFSTTVTVRINTGLTAVNDAVVVSGTPLPLVLPAGPYLQVLAANSVISFGTYRLTGDFLFEKATDYGTDKAVGGTGTAADTGVLTIAMAGVTLKRLNATTSTYDALPLSNITGVLLVLSKTGQTGYVVQLTGRVTGGFDGFTAGADLGVAVNTTTTAVDRVVLVNGNEVRVTVGPGTATAPYVALVAKNVALDFGDVLEIQGDFALDTNGNFSGTGLRVFVGKGPSRIGGVTNPDAIGLLITNASIDIHRGIGADATAYALRVTGGVAFLGLDGLQISGTVDFRYNTGAAAYTFGTDKVVNAQTFSLVVDGLHLGVAGVLDVTGTLVVNREPNGALNLAIGNAVVTVSLARHRDHLARRLRRLLDLPDHRVPAHRVQGQLVLAVPVARPARRPDGHHQPGRAEAGAVPDRRPGPAPQRRHRGEEHVPDGRRSGLRRHRLLRGGLQRPQRHRDQARQHRRRRSRVRGLGQRHPGHRPGARPPRRQVGGQGQHLGLLVQRLDPRHRRRRGPVPGQRRHRQQRHRQHGRDRALLPGERRRPTSPVPSRCWPAR